MNKDQNDEALLKQVKATLEAAANDLDPALVTRLKGIRREAISQAGRRYFFQSWQWGGAVAATVLIVMFSLNLQNDNVENRIIIENGIIENVAGLDDLQMLSAAEDLDLYEDLEFYSWLDEIQKTG